MCYERSGYYRINDSYGLHHVDVDGLLWFSVYKIYTKIKMLCVEVQLDNVIVLLHEPYILFLFWVMAGGAIINQ